MVRPRQRSTRLSYQGLHGYENNNNNEHTVFNDEFWLRYKEYLLRNYNKQTAKARISYAKKFCHVLVKDNAQDLLILSNETRIHVMKSLAALSKYLGCYDIWKAIIERYQLKWSNEDGLGMFNNIMMDNTQNYTSMINWLKDTCSKLTRSYSNILIYGVLTGLRPDETCHSIRLLHTEHDNYLNKESMVLEHFKYPEIFIRRTKKAYISILTDQILEIAKEAGDYGYNALRLKVKRKGLDMNMAFCRKIFATHLRSNGIEQETIDLLQGRIPKSVFGRHYFRPDFSRQRIKDAITSLYESLRIS
jgi:hypothetical protein